MTALPAALATQRLRIARLRGFDPRAELKATQARMALMFRARHSKTGPEIARNYLNRARALRAAMKEPK